MGGHVPILAWYADAVSAHYSDDGGGSGAHSNFNLGSAGVLGARTSTGLTALHIAAMKGHTPCVIWLTEHGLDPTAGDAAKRTPLHLAVRNVHDTTVWWLLESGGANPRAVDSAGQSPLSLATSLLAQQGSASSPSAAALGRIKEYMSASASPPGAPSAPVELSAEAAAALASSEREAALEAAETAAAAAAAAAGGEATGGVNTAAAAAAAGAAASTGGAAVSAGAAAKAALKLAQALTAAPRDHPASLPPPGAGSTSTCVFVTWDPPPCPPAGGKATEYTLQVCSQKVSVCMVSDRR